MYVLIATAGRPDLLRRTLTSIAGCRFPEEYAGLFVVENGARRGAEAVVAEFAGGPLRARYLFSEAPNKSLALNLAMEQLGGDELVVFTDDDVRVREEWLEAYAQAARESGPGTMLGGPFDIDYEQAPPDWLKRYLPASAVGMTDASRWPIGGDEFKGFLGFNWAAYVRDLRDRGGFNERVGPGLVAVGQETEMQERLIRAGVRPKMVRDAMVWHYVPVARCSESWTLERSGRRGRSSGRKEREKLEQASRGASSYGRLLRATSVRLFFAGRFWLQSRLPGRGPAARFEARYRYERYHGWVRGLWDTGTAA
jgi:GT2 family glycosyltransferase